MARVQTDSEVATRDRADVPGAPVKPKKPRASYKLVRTRAYYTDGGVFVVHIGHRLRNPESGRMHWGAKAAMKDKFEKAVAAHPAPLLLVKRIHFTRWIGKHGKLFDETDNLNVAFKWFRDAACKWLGRDDGPRSGIEFTYEQLKNGTDWGVTVRFS